MAKPDDVRALVENVPDDVLLVMDEAYYEFLDAPVDLLPLIRSEDKPNLLVMRTFSKIYGLAGLRIGYGIGHPDFISALEKEIKLNKRTFSDFSVLYRTNAQSRALEDSFRRMGIPYNLVGSIRFYDRKEVKDVLAYLRLVINFIPSCLVILFNLISLDA